MTLTASTYFEHLKAYVNSQYVIHDGTGRRVVLKEKYFSSEDVESQERQIELLLPGVGMAFKLDHDDFSTTKKNTKGKTKKSKPPLFHFLDDNAKPWSKRCDFVIFYVNRNTFHADCIEFKSKSLIVENIVPQLQAGTCWVQSLKRTIEYYTGYRKRIHLRKFVFGENEKPDAYLDQNRQLNADPSIRYYHFNEVQGQHLDKLVNRSVQTI